MPTEISPKDVQQQVQYGFDRLKNFKQARVMFLRNYVGQYYDQKSGEIGTEPLNLIFNAIRTLVPHMVMNFPKHTVETKFLAYREYAGLLSLTLEQHDQQIKVTQLYRRWLVDAIFTLGIMKTGLAQSDSVYALNEYDNVDAGTVFSEIVDFDDYVVDPKSRQHLFCDAAWEGDRLCVPRSLLLDSGQYKNDLVERLPSVGHGDREKTAKELSMRGIHEDDVYDSEDYVEVAEIWVRGANAIVTVPATDDVVLEDYLRIDDFYGPSDGPYTKLALTPPVSGNPLPVPTVGVWNDLHILANRMAKKIIDQAQRQKDIVTYKRTAADDAEELRNARDGEAVAVDDPDAVEVVSFGGQQNSNESHLFALQSWFSMMSSNPEQLAGARDDAGSATAATILQTNASIGLEDAKNLMYAAAVEESRRRAWYFHTDPLIQIPLTRRVYQQAQFMQGAAGPVLMQPPQMTEQQIILTPEVRRGEFLDFAFKITAESMGRVDSKTRFAQAIDFCTKILPSVLSAAQAAMMLAIPFSAKAMILRMAKDANIDWMDEVFYDPEFQMQMAQLMMMGPQMQDSKGQAGGPKQGGMGGALQPGGNMMGQIMQNGQPSNIPNNPDPASQLLSNQQAGAIPGQQMVKGMY